MAPVKHPSPKTGQDDLILQQFALNSFAGIDRNHPVVIVYPDHNKVKPIIKIEGDQRTGKSSRLRGILFGLGGFFKFKNEELRNKDDKTLHGDHEFLKNGVQYRVSFRKDDFKIYRFFKDKESNQQGWIYHGGKDMLRDLIGTIATSPQDLVETKDGKDQLKWLYKTLNVPEAIQAEEEKIDSSYVLVSKGRKEANKEYEKLKTLLQANPMYINWEHSEKKYQEIKTIETAKTKFTNATQHKEKYDEALMKTNNLKNEIKKKQDEITVLEETLAIGEKYIELKAGIPAQYKKAQEEFTSISEYLHEQRDWNQTVADKKFMDELETAVQEADAAKDRLLQKKRDLVKKVVPDIEGLVVNTEDAIDGPKIGITYLGYTPAQLCESDLWGLYFELFRAGGGRVAVIENMSNLGSEAVKILNNLARKGVYIFATEMKRGQPKVSVTFLDKIV